MAYTCIRTWPKRWTRPRTAPPPLAARRLNWPRILAGWDLTYGMRTWFTPARTRFPAWDARAPASRTVPARICGSPRASRPSTRCGRRARAWGSAWMARPQTTAHTCSRRYGRLLLHRVSGDPAALTARETLWLATRGGAAVLGRDDIGCLAPGMAADFIGYRLDTLSLAGGAVHDPLAALVFCHPPQVDLSVINGRVRVQDQQLLDIDLPVLIERHNAIARALVRGELR